MTPDTPDSSSRCIDTLCRHFKENAGRIPVLMEMLEAGVPVPFIARYRKSRTGGMDETRIREIRQYAADFRRHEVVRRETLATLGEGTAEIQRLVIARHPLREGPGTAR